MANIFTNMINNFGDWLGSRIAPYINDELGRRDNILANYYRGDHRAQLKKRVGQPDDNIVQNFVGLAIDRSVSRLFRGGVKWKLPEGAEKQQEYLDKLWDLNKKEILLYQIGLHGSVYGTTYIKILPDALLDPFTNYLYPRLVALDPEIIRVKTNPQDMSIVQEYRIQYSVIEKLPSGVEITVAHREIIRPSRQDDYIAGSDMPALENDTWQVEEYEQQGSGPWRLTDKREWPYDFPPIIHWKNLPSLKSCYGDSDIDDAINVQDKSNFVISNTGKIIKYHAHPQTVGTGFQVKDMQPLDTAVGTFRAVPNPEAKIYNLEMQSDLAASRSFALDLRQSIFDIAREIDLSTISDKLGTLTNFGLRVLYTDAIDKNDTKRQLYGDALKEVNRRLLVLNGFEMEESNPGEIGWGDALPVDIFQEMTADKLALDMGIVDHETVAGRYFSRYNVDWETIQANLANEQTATNQNNANVGAQILRNFNRGL
jgi:hypothetical protein